MHYAERDEMSTETEVSAEGVPIVNDPRCLACARSEWQSSARRDLYLLRHVPDVPLSIDKMVLPGSLGCLHDSDELHVVGIAFPETERTRYTAEARRLHGFTLSSDAVFCGFDVADPAISGLSNCGYGTEENRRAAAATWAHALNPHHLFSLRTHAARFRSFTNRRVPEHAPFLVVALFVVTAPTSEGAGYRDGPR